MRERRWEGKRDEQNVSYIIRDRTQSALSLLLLLLFRQDEKAFCVMNITASCTSTRHNTHWQIYNGTKSATQKLRCLFYCHFFSSSSSRSEWRMERKEGEKTHAEDGKSIKFIRFVSARIYLLYLRLCGGLSSALPRSALCMFAGHQCVYSGYAVLGCVYVNSCWLCTAGVQWE